MVVYNRQNEHVLEGQFSRQREIDSLRQVERERQALKRRRRLRLVAATALYGIVLSILGLYITLPARLAESVDYYTFELIRPELVPFLRVSISAILSGALVTGSLVYVFSGVAVRRRHPLIWGAVGLAYGLAISFVTGLFIPTVGGIVDLLTGHSSLGALWNSLLYLVLGTPLFAAVYGILGLYVGLLQGLLLAIGGWLMDVVSASVNTRTARYGPVAVSVILSFLVAVPVLVGPFSLFKSLVQTWAMQ